MNVWLDLQNVSKEILFVLRQHTTEPWIAYTGYWKMEQIQTFLIVGYVYCMQIMNLKLMKLTFFH